MPLSASFTVLINAVQTPAAGVGELVSAPVTVNHSYGMSLADGTAANQADRLFVDQRTLLTAANEDLDLSGLLQPFFGASTMALVKLKAFGLFSKASNTTNLTVSRGATNGSLLFTAVSSGVAAIKPGCGFLWWDSSLAGVAVTGGTVDLINVANSAGASAVYDVYIIGTSA